MSEHHIEFEWSAQKAASNVRKHGVSFEEAQTAFRDVHAYVQPDELHSELEERTWLIGYSNRNRLLIISFTAESPNRVRIISARRVTRRERQIYEERSHF